MSQEEDKVNEEKIWSLKKKILLNLSFIDKAY